MQKNKHQERVTRFGVSSLRRIYTKVCEVQKKKKHVKAEKKMAGMIRHLRLSYQLLLKVEEAQSSSPACCFRFTVQTEGHTILPRPKNYP